MAAPTFFPVTLTISIFFLLFYVSNRRVQPSEPGGGQQQHCCPSAARICRASAQCDGAGWTGGSAAVHHSQFGHVSGKNQEINWDWDWEAIRNHNHLLLLLLSAIIWLNSNCFLFLILFHFFRRPGSAMRRRIFSLCSGKWSPGIRESRCKRKVRWTLAMEAQMMLLRRRIAFATLCSSFAMSRWRIEEGVLIW